MTTIPLVSIVIVTYQHAKYIKDCLEGALSQKTTFPVEIIVGEDESNDGTREICQEYADKHPETIRLFLRSRKDVIYINGKATGRFNFIETVLEAKGKYLALCEGDDFWTDPLKLQKQIDFLETNPDFAVCFHPAYELYDNMEKRVSNKDLSKEIFTIEDLGHGNFLHTPTVVYRNLFKGNLPAWFKHIPVGDYPLHLLHARNGKIKFMPEPMACYRVHSMGLWSGLNKRDSYLKKIHVLEILLEADFSKEISKLLAAQKSKAINELLNIHLDSNWNDLMIDLKQFAEKDEELFKTWLTSSTVSKNIDKLPFDWKSRVARLRNIFKR